MWLPSSRGPVWLGGLILLVSFSACDPIASIELPPALQPTEVEFHPNLGVDLDQMMLSETGLYYSTLTEGMGEDLAAAGDSVDVHFTLWRNDGPEVDSSEGLDPLGFTLGSGRAIRGFDEGVHGMKVGELRLLVLPYQLAYGAGELPGLPPYSILVFRVQLEALYKAEP